MGNVLKKCKVILKDAEMHRVFFVFKAGFSMNSCSMLWKNPPQKTIDVFQDSDAADSNASVNRALIYSTPSSSYSSRSKQ